MCHHVLRVSRVVAVSATLVLVPAGVANASTIGAAHAGRVAVRCGQRPWSRPLRGATLCTPVIAPVTSPFGWRIHPITHRREFHGGVDLGAGRGTPIHAAAAGVVIAAGLRGGYGNTVMIDHGGGLVTLYAHQSRTAARVGERVYAGEIIGYVGATGIATGAHLHFEVRVHGVPVNPSPYLAS